MKVALIAIAVTLSLGCIAGAQEKQPAKSPAGPSQLEARERKLWEAFQKKDKTTLSGLLDDGFRQFEEGQSTFGDKKSEVNGPDEFDLITYKLSDFTIKPLGPNAALVTYIAEYEGKSGGESSKAKSVFAEVWVRSGGEWKDSYMQETYVK